MASFTYPIKLIDFLLPQEGVVGKTNPPALVVNILTKTTNFDG